MSGDQRFFKLDLDDLAPRQYDDPTQIPERVIRIDRARGDFCGCCGGACIRACRGDGRGGTRLVLGGVLLLASVVGMVLLLILLLSIQSEVVAETASGELA